MTEEKEQKECRCVITFDTGKPVWTSVLDSDTCTICMGLHGSEFLLGTDKRPPIACGELL